MSLVLCLAAAGAWVCASLYADVVPRADVDRLGCGVLRTGLCLWWRADPPEFWGYHSDFFGFGYTHGYLQAPSQPGVLAIKWLTVPWWLPFALTAILPTLWLWRWNRHRRATHDGTPHLPQVPPRPDHNDGAEPSHGLDSRRPCSPGHPQVRHLRGMSGRRRARAVIVAGLCGFFAALWFVSLCARISIGRGRDTSTDGSALPRPEWELVLAEGVVGVAHSEMDPASAPGNVSPVSGDPPGTQVRAERRYTDLLDSFYLPDWRRSLDENSAVIGRFVFRSWPQSFLIMPLWLLAGLFGALAYLCRDCHPDSASVAVPMPRPARKCLLVAAPLALLWLLPELWVRFNIPFMYYPSGRTPMGFEVATYVFRRQLAPLIAMILCGAAILIRRQARRQARRWAAGLCPRCGHDLRASGHWCPKCGTPIPADLVRRPLM